MATVKPIKLPKYRKQKRNRPIPGDRVQMDTKKLALGKYQYTAIDVERCRSSIHPVKRTHTRTKLSARSGDQKVETMSMNRTP